MTYTLKLKDVRIGDVSIVGGKNASLGEMIHHLTDKGVRVPGGFATTADAFQEFLDINKLTSSINQLLDDLDVNNLQELSKTGNEIRDLITNAPLPDNLLNAIKDSYAEMEHALGENIAVAVRSSATAEDLPEASFAGQQESFLNISGIDSVISAVKQVYASLFNDRAIAYRVHKGFQHSDVSISVGVQQMVRSDLASSGVMFTLDTESGFRDAVFITASYGLGEAVVQGEVNPDEFYVFKPTLKLNKPAITFRSLGSKRMKMIYDSNGGVKKVEVSVEEQNNFCISDHDVEELARIGCLIEEKYQCPMDIEWAKDGVTDKLYIVQARPETVMSQNQQAVERYTLKNRTEVLVTGRSIGQKIANGMVSIIDSIENIEDLNDGEVLVTDMTDPDWEPVMQRASAIVTNRGGRTCHAAIIARELGVPAIVGCGDATEKLTQNQSVTISCAEGDTGYVYSGELDYEVNRFEFDNVPKIACKIMANVGNPFRAFSFSQIPNDGVGLARLEFIINKMVGVHPQALLEFNSLSKELQTIIKTLMVPYQDPIEFYVDKLRQGVSTIAAAFYPKPVIVRLSDFKSNEYAHMTGGSLYEPHEENPMIGFRGASRYISDSFKSSFELECRALKIVRDEMNLTNVKIMVPFVRTTQEAKQVIELLKQNGLERGKNGLEVIMMCEIPSNAILAEEFLEYFDGFSIGSNDLTQMTLALDRDSEIIADKFDERNEAVKTLIQNVIQACKKSKKYIGICGQGPSDYPDFAEWLLKEGIDSISLNPDSIVATMMQLGKS